MAKRYRSAEVCRLLELQPYVLRYWATEFPTLTAPSEGAGGQASYGEEDLAQLKRIKRLLYEEGYTIAGARKKLESEPAGVEETQVAPLFDEEESSAAEAVEDAVDASGSKATAKIAARERERIVRFERGVAAALNEARELLARLERGR